MEILLKPSYENLDRLRTECEKIDKKYSNKGINTFAASTTANIFTVDINSIVLFSYAYHNYRCPQSGEAPERIEVLQQITSLRIASFIRIYSAAEYNFKIFSRILNDDPKKRATIGTIVKEFKSLGLLPERHVKVWLLLMNLRDDIIHNGNKATHNYDFEDLSEHIKIHKGENIAASNTGIDSLLSYIVISLGEIYYRFDNHQNSQTGLRINRRR